MVIDPKREIAAKVGMLSEVEVRPYPSLEAYMNRWGTILPVGLLT